MSLLSREDLRKALKEGRIELVYLLFGPEDYLRSRAARAITDASLRKAPLREFNETSFSLRSTEIQDAVAAAEQLPMMAERRVVQITDLSKLYERDEEEVEDGSTGGKRNPKDPVKVLERYLARPAPSTVVIFTTNDLDKRRKLTKLLLDSCCAVEFERLDDSELTRWARGRAKELKMDIDLRTLGYLVALVGNDVRRLASELEKVATAAIGNGPVSVELIDSLVSHSRELSNFELTDNMVSRNRKQALRTLGKLINDGVPPVMLIGLIAGNYHRLALAKALVASGATKEEVFRVVGMPFKKRAAFLELARHTDADSFARSLKRIAAADLAIKTSLATPAMQLELLVCELSAQ